MLKKRTIWGCVGAAVLSMYFSTSAAFADRADNVELQRKLYARLSELISVDTASNRMAGAYLVLAPGGGFLLDPALNPDTNPRDKRTLITNFMDIRIKENWMLTKENDSMGPIYYRALRYIETPDFSLSETDKKKYAKLDKDLYHPRTRNPTKLLERYEDAWDALENVIIRIDNWQKIHPGEPYPRSLVSEHRQAIRNYRVRAQGPFVAEKLRKHTEYNFKRSQAWITDLEDRYHMNFNVSGNYGNVDYYPSYKTWLNPNLSWPKITSTSKDFQQTAHNSQTSYGGGLSGSWGLFRIGGNYSSDETKRHKETTVSKINLEFELLQVSLRMPFMDLNYFSSGTWDWSASSGHAGKLISDGNYDPDSVLKPPLELLPFVPVTLLVARNVSLSADWKFNLEDFVSTRKQGGGSFGWGPFSFGGRYDRSTSDSYVVANARGNKLEFNSPQIIGYFVQMLPKSPVRDPKLPWPPKAKDRGPEPKDELLRRALEQEKYYSVKDE